MDYLYPKLVLLCKITLSILRLVPAGVRAARPGATFRQQFVLPFPLPRNILQLITKNDVLLALAAGNYSR